MRRPAFVLMAVLAAACSSPNASREARTERACARLADRLELRLRAHEADRRLLGSWASADRQTQSAQALGPTLNDAVATYQTLLQVGGGCAQVITSDECALITTGMFLEDVDRSFNRMHALLEGLRGRGACRRDPGIPGDPCDSLALHLRAEATFLELVRTGWQHPVDDQGRPAEHAAFAATKMAEWRAFVDYGLAAAPACAQRAAPPCAHLREGLVDAAPDELVARMNALSEAYRHGTPCPTAATTGSATAPGTSR